jgi:hypothetical protein
MVVAKINNKKIIPCVHAPTFVFSWGTRTLHLSVTFVPPTNEIAINLAVGVLCGACVCTCTICMHARVHLHSKMHVSRVRVPWHASACFKCAKTSADVVCVTFCYGATCTWPLPWRLGIPRIMYGCLCYCKCTFPIKCIMEFGILFGGLKDSRVRVPCERLFPPLRERLLRNSHFVFHLRYHKQSFACARSPFLFQFSWLSSYISLCFQAC